MCRVVHFLRPQDGLDECGVCGGVGDSCAITAEFSVSLVAKTTSIEKAALLVGSEQATVSTGKECRRLQSLLHQMCSTLQNRCQGA